jgi:hypothetical protein
MPVRTKYFTYTNGRFLQKVKNALSQETIYNYEPVFCLRLVFSPTNLTSRLMKTPTSGKNPQMAGPAVYAARTILWKETNTEFVDNEKDHEPGLTAKIAFEKCYGELPTDLSIQLVDNNYNLQETVVQILSDGTLYIAPHELALLHPDINYTFIANYPIAAPTMPIFEWIYGTENIINMCPLGKKGSLALPKPKAENKPAAFYPNPAKNELLFSLPTHANYLVEIIDLLGKTQINSPINNADAQINTSTLTNGIYIVRIKDNNGSIVLTNKLLIEK